MNLDYRPQLNETLAEDPTTGDTWTIHHSDHKTIGSFHFVAVTIRREGDEAWGIDPHMDYWTSEDLIEELLYVTTERFATPAR